MKKAQIIQNIQDIISQNGIFDVADIQANYSPSIPTRGNLTSLVESFSLGYGIVVVYNRDYSIVDTYRLSYLEMYVDTLKQIRILCLLYEQQQLDLD